MMKIIDGGVTAAEGFQAAGLAAGIKKGNTKDILTDVEILINNNIDVPKLPLLTYLAKIKKNIKLFYHYDVRDIIKDIYKHV